MPSARHLAMAATFALALAPHGRGESVQVVGGQGPAGARQPQAAVTSDGSVYVAFGAKDVIYCSISRDASESFGQAVRVGARGKLALGHRRGPRIAAWKDQLVITAICGEIGGGKDGDVVAWRSRDRGATWTGPVRVNSVAGAAREGLHHLAVSPDGLFFCVWNDLRVPKQMPVYGAGSTDGGATWQPDRLVYASPEGSICPCCQSVAAFDSRGRLHVMWRNSLGGARDMYLNTSTDGGKTFSAARKLGLGEWQTDVCPMDAGGLAGGLDGPLVTIWMRDGQIFRCEPGKSEQLLGRGTQGWAASGPDGAYLAWLERRPGRLLALPPGGKGPITLSERASDPVVAGSADGKGPVVAVWEDSTGEGVTLRATRLSK